MGLSESCTFDPDGGFVIGRRGRPIGNLNYSGYVDVRIAGRMFRAHRLIWESVHGPIPEGMEINHLNGVKSDNRICNLELADRSTNLLHAFKTGLCRAVGANHPRAVLTRDAVKEIRASSEGDKTLGRRFGVSASTIKAAREYRTWKEYAP